MATVSQLLFLLFMYHPYFILGENAHIRVHDNLGFKLSVVQSVERQWRDIWFASSGYSASDEWFDQGMLLVQNLVGLSGSTLYFRQW